jgi:4-amino-4-deoxy-L-arabinose transferase-like glycosyltransferase
MVTEAKVLANGGASPPYQNNLRWFWILLGLYFLTRLPWLFMVPMVEAPDEFSHFWVLRFLFEHLRLPEAQEIIAGGPSAVYGSLPPLGYLPHVAAGMIGHVFAPAVDLSVTSRFGSLISGVVLLWCSWEFGRKLFSQDKFLTLALPLIVVFQPQMVLVNSYANSDTVTASLAALALLLVCKMMENGLNSRSSFALGLTLGWLALTKYPGLSVFPSCALGYVFAAWLNCQSIKKFFGQAAIATITTFAACTWWFIRNAMILDGDFLGTKTMFHTWAVTYHKSLTPDISAWAVLKQKPWWRFTVFSFWGMFGYMTRYLWRPIYWVYIVFMILAILGGIKGGIQALVLKLTHHKESNFSLSSLNALTERERKDRFGKATIWLVLATCFLTNFSLMIYSSMKNLGGGQGRYLFPSEIPIIALIAGGLYLTGTKTRKPLILLLVAFNIVVYIAAFCMLCPEYGFHFLKTY